MHPGEDPLIDFFWQTTTAIGSLVATLSPVTCPGNWDHRREELT